MALNPTLTDIKKIMFDLTQLCQPVLERKNVTFTCFVHDSLSDPVFINQNYLKVCLSNLLSNAVKYTFSGRVHTHITSRLLDRSGALEISIIVADTGQGMTLSHQEKLFTKYNMMKWLKN